MSRIYDSAINSKISEAKSAEFSCVVRITKGTLAKHYMYLVNTKHGTCLYSQACLVFKSHKTLR